MTDIQDPKQLAMTLLIGHRLGMPEPVKAAELTAIREAVEDRIEESAKDLNHAEAPGGWTTEQVLAHRAMDAAMDLVIEVVVPTAQAHVDAALTSSEPPARNPMSATAGKLPFKVLWDDNFDVDARSICAGQFATAEEAIELCRQIVDEFLDGSQKPGMTAADLYELYTMFGEDPWVVGPTRGTFSAWDYARQRCDEICRQGHFG